MEHTPVTIERAYKILQNHLSKTEVIDSLYAIWAYMGNITNRKPFPHDIQPFSGFLAADDVQRLRWVTPWDLETLAREVIVNSALNLISPNTLRDGGYFSSAMGKLSDIEGAISDKHIDVTNVLKELERIPHRQFTWQVNRANTINLARYYKIFGHLGTSHLIEEKTGLSTQKIFGIGIMFWDQFTKRFAVPSIRFDIPEIQQEDVHNFERIFSIEIDELRSLMRNEIQINDKFNYAFHSLKRFPLLRNSCVNGETLFCPFPDLIFRQITSGIYYLVNWTGLSGNILGEAFQIYIGDVLDATRLAPQYLILPEDSFGKSQKNTVDWIVTNKEEALFVECKTKRLTFASKEELLSDNNTDRDLDDIAEAVVQIYKTIGDYNDNKYPSLPYMERRRIYPIVVTMEDWFLMGDGLVSVKNKVLKKLDKLNLPSAWLDTMPFSICSTQEFESLVHILRNEAAAIVIEGKQKDPEMLSWAYASYFHNKYRHLLDKKKELFPYIFQEILPISIPKKK